MVDGGLDIRELRALRYNPPGYAKRDARRTQFQSALEQFEQFLTAAAEAGYATRPVQLFYAISQAGRAIVAASPNIGNQAWRVNGHGLSASTGCLRVADTTVTAANTGLFQSVATALSVPTLVADEPVALRQLWALLPEALFSPLTSDALLPVLCFLPSGTFGFEFSEAEIAWIPHSVRDQCGDSPERVKDYLDRYPALEGSVLWPERRLDWGSGGHGLRLHVAWRDGTPPILLADNKTIRELGVATYRSSEDFLITPAIGSMSGAFHPILALWSVLLALSSLARYEPAGWSKMIDIDQSPEANAIEHLLDEASSSIPAAVLQQLRSFES